MSKAKPGGFRPCPPLKPHVSGQARCRWSEGGRRREKWFGVWGHAETVRAYARFAAEWAATQGRPVETPRPDSLTVAELVERFAEWARGPEGYLKEGKLTSEYNAYRTVWRTWVPLYGNEAVGGMRPTHLRAVREVWLARGLCRNTVNAYADRLVRMVAWGVGRELAPAEVLAPLREVRRLRRGKTTAPDRPPVRPVGWDAIEATVRHLGGAFGRDRPERRAILEAMVRVQALGRMRPGELVGMRPELVDRSQVPWRYDPPAHKTLHRDKPRAVFFGPRAREILGPVLDAARPGEPLWRVPAATGRRLITPSGHRFTDWIRSAAARAGVEPWSANRLRHRGATDVHEQYEDDEAVAAALGNTPEIARQVYTDRPEERAARRIAEATG